MPSVHALVLTGYGTNCERETAFACRAAGAERTVIAHFADLIQEQYLLEDFNFLIFPGGFLDGDHLGGAQAAAVRFTSARTRSGRSLVQDIRQLHARGGLIMGICNGFQLLVKLGLLPGLQSPVPARCLSLSHNESGRFEDRWVHLHCLEDSPCVFTRGLDRIYLPVRHGEGRLIARDAATLQDIETGRLIALQYTDPGGRITQSYPHNPNGSPLGIAGLTDPTGRIFGLMPHPEAFNHPTNHPAWTRGETSLSGTRLFSQGIDFLKQTDPPESRSCP